MSHFIETAARQHSSLIVNSTPLVIRSLQGLFPHSHHDLTPIAALIGDYGAFVVRADSPLEDWSDIEPGDAKLVEFDYPKKSD